MTRVDQLIAALDLRPLPLEGGYYRETYRSPLRMTGASRGAPEAVDKSAATAIYYLLAPGACSRLHRLPSDEIYHFYAGDPVELLLLEEAGARLVLLGNDPLGGQQPQCVVPAGVWQGSVLRAGGAFALLGTTMTPGFDFADLELAPAAELMARYPAQAARIARLCQ